jgi:hypothetical protein
VGFLAVGSGGHPRSRGEQRIAATWYTVCVGPSPRARGAAERARAAGRAGGSIPAGAGSSLPDQRVYGPLPDSHTSFTETDTAPHTPSASRRDDPARAGEQGLGRRTGGRGDCLRMGSRAWMSGALRVPGSVLALAGYMPMPACMICTKFSHTAVNGCAARVLIFLWQTVGESFWAGESARGRGSFGVG